MSSIRILFVGFKDLADPCYRDLLEVVGGQSTVSVYDPGRPIADQFHQVRGGVDQGGWGTHAMVDTAKAAGVELWQVIGTGLDQLDVKYILEKGIVLANTPGIFSGIALAEHALFLMLCFAKNLHQSLENVRSGVFFHPINEELQDKTLGLVGFGASARELAKRAWALGMRVLAIDALDLPHSVRDEYQLEFLGAEGSNFGTSSTAPEIQLPELGNGKWRIWAVLPDGLRSAASEWRSIAYRPQSA